MFERENGWGERRFDIKFHVKRGNVAFVTQRNVFNCKVQDGYTSGLTVEKILKMKPAPPDRCISKPRALRSLYTDSSVSGKREANSTKIPGRKTVFKPPANSMKLRSNPSVQGNIIARRTQTGLKGKDSMKMLRAVSTMTGMQQCPQMNGFFVRPSVDVRNLQQQIMERAKRMEDMLKTEGKNLKALNHTIIKSPAVPCTPKPSGLSMAYLKLSNYKGRSAPLQKTRLTQFLDKGCLQNKNHLDVNRVAIVNHKGNSVVADSVDAASQHSTSQTRKETVTFSSGKEICTDSSSNDVGERVNSVENEKSRHYALNNILKHYQEYTCDMVNVNKEIDLLDGEFQSVMIGGMDNRLTAKFFDYQNRKKEIYRKMKLLEGKLEESVKKELDVESKFKEYLSKKKAMLKDRTELHHNFEKLLKEAIEKYKVDSENPPDKENIEELVKAVVNGSERRDEMGERVLRRSKRLSGIPLVEDEEVKTPRKVLSGRKSKKEGKEKKVKDKDELIVKRGRRSCDVRRIQTCMYKDLQKSFNLCSPECSF